MKVFPELAIARLLVIVSLLSLTGCSTMEYYRQSVFGHLGLMFSRQPIDTLLEDEQLPPALRAELTEALAVREFASRELALPENNSYRTYVDVGRRYVVWSVVATPEFSLRPQSWCFPVVGCVSYRGYFAESAATQFADSLREEGMDVYSAGVRAYSTLGWFDDPLLNTMLESSQPHYLPAVLFHELVHQRIYVRDDTAFNEAVAMTVERAGVRRWLEANGKSDVLAHYSRHSNRQADFLALIDWAREQLNAVYETGNEAAVMRRAKAKVLDELRVRYARLRPRWQGFRGYDAWFETDLNNAKLASVATYFHWVPALERLLEERGGRLPDFFEAVDELSALPAAERDTRLSALTE